MEVVQARARRRRPRRPCGRDSSISAFTFSTTSSMRAGMDAAVGDQALDRLPRDLAAVRVEAGEDDRARRVVDDEVDAGGRSSARMLRPSRPMIRPFRSSLGRSTTGDRGLDRVFGGAALDGLRDDGARALGGLLARFGLEPLDQPGGVARASASICFSSSSRASSARQARHALELAAAARGEPPRIRAVAAVTRLSRAASRRSAPRRDPCPARSSGRCCSVGAASRCGEQLLHAGDLLALIADELLGLRARSSWARLRAPRASLPCGACRRRARRRAGSGRPVPRRGPRSRPRCASGSRPSSANDCGGAGEGDEEVEDAR